MNRIDLHEDKEKNLVTATFELPGLKKEDVNIDVHNNVLTVSGETKSETSQDEGGFVLRERRFGRFSRSLPVPPGIKVGTATRGSVLFLRRADCELFSLRRSRHPWPKVS